MMDHARPRNNTHSWDDIDLKFIQKVLNTLRLNFLGEALQESRKSPNKGKEDKGVEVQEPEKVINMRQK